MTKRYALVGEQLVHSFSERIHRHFAYEYKAVRVAAEDFASFVAHNTLDGFNLTIPYKERVLPLLDYVDPLAARIGAVNTVLRRDGRLLGYNTDIGGMRFALSKASLSLFGRRTLILGTGGTSRTAAALCRELGAARIEKAGRCAELNYENVYEKAVDCDFIINTTPCGMFPHNGEVLLSLPVFRHLQGVFDVVYNPLRTALLLQADSLGIPCSGGLYMLVAQAVLSRNLFLEEKADTPATDTSASIGTLYRRLLSEQENIVLIGMPGCGKSLLGKILAEKLNRHFVDTDVWIAARTGCEIETLFEQKGEVGFRAIERETVAEAGKLTGCVIAAGGGAVCDPMNYEALRQNGLLVYVQRPPDQLAVAHRPLSQKGRSLEALFAQRDPLYRKYASLCVGNVDTPEACAETLSARLKDYYQNL